jgi:hypothetical protein
VSNESDLRVAKLTCAIVKLCSTHPYRDEALAAVEVALNLGRLGVAGNNESEITWCTETAQRVTRQLHQAGALAGLYGKPS